MKNKLFTAYKNKKVLITGGLGFMGSNLAHALVALGAKVTLLDNMAPLYGGNMFNIKGIEKQISILIGDIRDSDMILKAVADKDIIFDLAAQVSHIDSGNIPFEDLDINCVGHLTILECCRKVNKNVKIVFTSSRLALGKIVEDPVTENHPTNPLCIYGIHKLTAEKYFQLYHKNYGMKTIILRITNPYGERQQIKHSKYSIPGWFMRLSMEGSTIKIFGNGTQRRDYIHASDLVDALLHSAICVGMDGEIYNCGSGRSVEFNTMVETVVRTVGKGNIEHVPWPNHYEKEETGDFENDISKLVNATGWAPKMDLEQGIKRMFEYYKKHKDKYIPNK